MTWTRRRFIRSGGVAATVVAVPTSLGRPRFLLRSDSWIPSRELADRIPRLLTEARVPGLAMAVVEDGGVAWTGAFGIGEGDGGEPVREDSLFEAASLSKPVFTHLVLDLVAAGQLDLDRPLAEYLAPPDVVADPAAAGITARHVLSHSSGFPNWRFRAVDELRVRFEPGSRFSYSGEGYFWLQRVVESVVGAPFGRYTRERLLEPIGMHASRFAARDDSDRPAVHAHDAEGNRVDSYGRRLDGALAKSPSVRGKPREDWTYEDNRRALQESDLDLAPLPNFMGPNAAGSLVTSAPDFGTFLAFILDPPAGHPAALDPALRREMLSTQIAIRESVAWGLGWGLERQGDRALAWHWGDNVFFKTFALLEVESGRGLVVLTNGQNGEAVYRPVVTEATGLALDAFNGV